MENLNALDGKTRKVKEGQATKKGLTTSSYGNKKNVTLLLSQ